MVHQREILKENAALQDGCHASNTGASGASRSGDVGNYGPMVGCVFDVAIGNALLRIYVQCEFNLNNWSHSVECDCWAHMGGGKGHGAYGEADSDSRIMWRQV